MEVSPVTARTFIAYDMSVNNGKMMFLEGRVASFQNQQFTLHASGKHPSRYSLLKWQRNFGLCTFSNV